MNLREDLAERFFDRRATVAIVGLGYVGVPLAAAFVTADYRVIGIDIDPDRVAGLQEGRSYVGHLPDEVFAGLAAAESFLATGDASRLAEADAVLICVGTPLDDKHAPDLTQVVQAAADIAAHGRPGQLVVLESTTYPGSTREVLVPALREQTSHVAYSPERVDPGAATALTAIPKLVAGVDATSADLAAALYSQVFAEVHRVDGVEIAEAAKLLENTFRAVNIALVNELKMCLGRLDVDIWEVIAAAATKPFGFMPFYPGPGVGGHCIPVDPTYLTWRGNSRQADLALTETAIRVNSAMPGYVVGRLAAALDEQGRDLAGARVVVVGLSYKPDIDDVRESPALDILDELDARGAAIAFHDPHVRAVDRESGALESIPWDAGVLAGFDAAVICTDHAAIDFGLLTGAPGVVVDTRNVLAARGIVPNGLVVKA